VPEKEINQQDFSAVFKKKTLRFSPGCRHCLPDRGKIDQELVIAIDAQNIVHYIVIVRSNGTDPAADCWCCKVQVLADMPCILVQLPVSPLTVSPRHPVGDGYPEEDHPAPHDKLLVETDLGDPDVERRVQIDLLETVGEGKVPVESRLKPFYIIDEQVGFESEAGPG
jgi:hypothetical protein